MSTHYVCTGGCGTVSDIPDICHALVCFKQTLPLSACSCVDGKHTEVFATSHTALNFIPSATPNQHLVHMDSLVHS